MNRLAMLAVTVALLLSAPLYADEPPTTAPSPAVTAPPLSGPLGEPIQLFNGKDLGGWVWYQRPPRQPTTGPATAPTTQATIDQVWSVKDGILHCKGRPTGYIRTEQAYANYVLTVEQRHLGKGNGGILFAITGPDKVWPRCLEAQGATGEEGDIRNIADFRMTMEGTRLEPRRLRRLGPSSEKPPGEWETIQIVVDHGNLTVSVNRQLQNLATDTEPLTGRIGLQSEGGEMEFRKVELRPIESR
jgi:hypothetical protein